MNMNTDMLASFGRVGGSVQSRTLDRRRAAETEVQPPPNGTSGDARPREAGPVTVRIIAWQKDRRDHAHVDQARAIGALFADWRGAPIDVVAVEVHEDDNQVPDAVRVPADVVVLLGHSEWEDYKTPTERWTGLLGVDRSRLAGAINANALVLATCKLYDLPELADLVAVSTPAVACDVETNFRRGYQQLIVGALLTELLRHGRPENWALALDDALLAARTQAAEAHPRSSHWGHWRFRTLEVATDRAAGHRQPA